MIWPRLRINRTSFPIHARSKVLFVAYRSLIIPLDPVVHDRPRPRCQPSRRKGARSAGAGHADDGGLRHQGRRGTAPRASVTNRSIGSLWMLSTRPEIDDNVVKGTGGAFRDKGHWYQLEFECTLTEDQRAAVSVDLRRRGWRFPRINGKSTGCGNRRLPAMSLAGAPDPAR